MTEASILIWCDDASHPARRPQVFVAEYRRHRTGIWFPVPEKRRNGLQRWRDGVIVTADDLWDSGDLDEAGNPIMAYSSKQNPECKWCKTPLHLSQGKFDAFMDAVHAAGRVEVRVSELHGVIDASRRRRP